MDFDQQKEQFTNAYVAAIAATAGYAIAKPSVDDDSVDWSIGARGGRGTIRSPRIELQLKGWESPAAVGDAWSYPLKLKNYDDLRPENVLVPRILVIVIVPPMSHYWLHQTAYRLALCHCGYWVSIRGMPETTNTGTVSVHVPMDQRFTASQLQSMMDRVGNGGFP